VRRFSVRALIVVLAVVVCALATRAQQYQYPFQNPNLPLEQRVDNILSLMTLDEKIAALGSPAVARLGIPAYGTSEGIHQVVLRGRGAMPGPGAIPQPGVAPPPGGNPPAGAPAAAPAAGAPGGARGAVPGIPTTSFAQVYGMGETWDPALIRRAGAVQGYEARYATQSDKYKRNALLLMGPTSDLARDPRWGRTDESYSEDPFLTGTMAVAFARGIQGDDPKYWQAAALLKHLFANSNETTRAFSSSDFDERLMREYYSVPFRMAFLEGGAKSFMAAYNAWNGIPMIVHPVLRDVVAKEWGAGWVISPDAGAMGHVVNLHKYYKTPLEANVAALKVGVGNLGGGMMGARGGVPTSELMKQALSQNMITEADLDAALKGKYKTIVKLGLLDPPGMVPYSTIGAAGEPEPWNGAKHKAVAAAVARESVVLLKNANGVLPLRRTALKSVAVVGPRAEKVMGDFYSSETPYSIGVLQGIKDKAGSAIAVTFAPNNDNGAAVEAAKRADVAIVVVGNDTFCGGNGPGGFNQDGSTVPCADKGDGKEGRDREIIDLSQEALVRQVYAANPKTIVVLVSSFPYAINWSQANVPAILHITHTAQDQGSAVADVLFGDYNPGGRTVQTWPKSLDQLPPMPDYDIRHGRTYLYFKGEPLYPFGFGLSYTTFEYSALKLSSPTLASKGTLTVSVDVRNTGKMAGDEVVQLYVQYPKSSVERPLKELKGFERVNLRAGEKKTVQIPLKAETLAWWNEKQRAWEVEPGPITLLIGSSSAAIRLRAQATVAK
jgi:beta-glucosidase